MADTTITPLPRLIDNALEMAEEITDRHGQYYTLASTIELGLAPGELGKDSPDWHCYRLSQLLAEAMSDMGQLYRLVKCLKAAMDAAANQCAEVKA